MFRKGPPRSANVVTRWPQQWRYNGKRDQTDFKTQPRIDKSMTPHTGRARVTHLAHRCVEHKADGHRSWHHTGQGPRAHHTPNAIATERPSANSLASCGSTPHKKRGSTRRVKCQARGGDLTRNVNLGWSGAWLDTKCQNHCSQGVGLTRNVKITVPRGWV